MSCIELLRGLSYSVGGISTPEMRSRGRRVGFSVVDIATGQRCARAATVIHIDGFGNLVTNVTYRVLDEIGVKDGSIFKVEVSGKEYAIPYARRFLAVLDGELVLLVAGGGYLELAINQGSAGERLGIKRGDAVRLVLIE